MGDGSTSVCSSRSGLVRASAPVSPSLKLPLLRVRLRGVRHAVVVPRFHPRAPGRGGRRRERRLTGGGVKSAAFKWHRRRRRHHADVRAQDDVSIVPMVPNVPWQFDRKRARDVPEAQAEQLSLGRLSAVLEDPGVLPLVDPCLLYTSPSPRD